MQREQAMTNCPNCGAVLNYDGGLHCDYCGAVFERPRVECAVKIHSPEVGEDMLRMLARGLCRTNEVRGMASPSDWPRAPTHETR